MVLPTDFTVAYKCPCCGAFEFLSISVFKLNRTKTVRGCRRCKESLFETEARSDGSFRFDVPCISCGGRHVFFLDRKAVINGETAIFPCERTGMEIFFTGRDSKVRSLVDKLENELEKLISMFGYERYFKNSRIMLDTLNIIHDIAEKKKLYCACGSRGIELVLLPGEIRLQCRNCFLWESLKAATNEDLKATMQRKKICLSRNYLKGIVSER